MRLIPNDPILTVDPWDSICMALETQLKTAIPALKNASQGWPDPKWFEDTGKNFPSVFFVPVGDPQGTNTTSRNNIFAVTNNADGTKNVYTEMMKMVYQMQISLFTADPQQRLDIGHAIKQFLIRTIQIPLNVVDTARFVYKHLDRMPPGRDNLYQRDLGFEVTARMLDGQVANVNKTIQQNNTISTEGVE